MARPVLLSEIMRLRSWTSAPLRAADRSLELLREIVAVVDPATPADARTRPRFASAHLHCQRGGPARVGEDCLGCDRIVSVLPSRGLRTITVRCLWTDTDAVAGMMTLPERIPRVDRASSLAGAAEVARRDGVHHLLVTDQGEVVGTTCECALAGEEAPVGARMIPHVWTIPGSATLGQVVAAMTDLEVGLLVVADHDVVLGTVTAQDLAVDVTPHVH